MSSNIADTLKQLSPTGVWPPPNMAAIYRDMGKYHNMYTGKQANQDDGIELDGADTILNTVGKYLTNQGRNTNGKSPTKAPQHLPVVSIIAAAMSDLLFSSSHQHQPAGGVTPELQPRVDRFNHILKRTKWDSRLPEIEELTAVWGGVWLRVNWDSDLFDHAFPEWVAPQHGVPVLKRGYLVGVLFHRTQVDKQHVYRHFEFYKKGAIEHALYEGTEDDIGQPIPLTDHPLTSGLVRVDPLTGELDSHLNANSEIETGYDGVAALWSHNRRPALKWSGNPAGDYLGRSEIDGIESALDMYMAAWRSWMRDLRVGAGSITVAAPMLESDNRKGGLLGRGIRDRGTGVTFDVDREVYTHVNALGNEDAALKDQMVANQFAIRVEEHKITCNAALEQIRMAVGLGAQAIGLTDGVSSQTATETNARDSKSSQTRKKKAQYRSDALEELYAILCAVDAYKFPEGGGGPVEWDVNFPEAQPTLHVMAAALTQIAAAESASIETRVRLLNPEQSDEWVDAEVHKIRVDKGLVGVDLDGLPE